MKKTFTLIFAVALSVNLIAKDSDSATKTFLKNAQQGGLKFNGAGVLHASSHCLLLVAEASGSLVAIDTEDTGKFTPVKPMANLGAKVAGAIGATPD